MPHVVGHIEDEPILDFTGAFGEDEPILDFTGAFGAGQGRTEQKFVPENNSIVTMPVNSSASFNSRESKELIEGQEGFFGNTSIQGLLDLVGAPGGFAETADIKKLLTTLDPLVTTITGAARERVILGAEKEPPSLAALGDIGSLASGAVADLAVGDFRGGVSKLFDLLGRARQVGLPGLVGGALEAAGILGGPFSGVADLIIQQNPELTQRFNDKMLELQAANEDFLIRNDLMFGPDDEPTLVGTLMSQLGLTGLGIGGSILVGNPIPAVVLFGAVQQVSGFQEAEEAGKDPFTAATIGDVQAVIEGGITFFEVGKLVSIITSRSTSIVAKIIALMLAEGIEESTTEALILGVQNATGVKDMTAEEALLTVFQAGFYGSLGGLGVSGPVLTIQRFADGNITQEEIKKVARVIDNVVTDEAAEITEQAIDDMDTELQIGRDIASGQPVTKTAKTTAKQQERVVEIIDAFNEGRNIDIQQALDEIFPEAKVQRQKVILEGSRRARTRAATKQAIKDEVVRLQAEIQIAEQQGNEERAAELSERIDQIQQLAFTDENIFDVVEELEAEGIFPRGDERLERAVAEIDNVLRPLRVGVRVGRVLQKEETRALQDSLTKIVDALTKKPHKGEAIVTGDPARRLQRKVREANTIASAERVRRDIISLGRKSAFAQFVAKRRVAISGLIKKNTDPKVKVGKLEPDSQNALDSMNKMRLGMKSAVNVKGLPPVDQRSAEEKEQVKTTRKQQVDDFNIKQSRRIQDDMKQGTPTEGVILQVRYLDILNEKSRVTPQVLAAFEDDLNAFIATGKGVATLADNARQKIVSDTKAKAKANPVKTLRADIEKESLVKWDQELAWFIESSQTQINAMQLGGTPFDLFQSEVDFRSEKLQRFRERDELMVAVSEGDSKKAAKYESELKDTVTNVIDVPLEGHAKTFDKKTRVRMTRGQLIYSWMLTREADIKKQVTDPNGKMVWTDKLMAMIEQRMTRQDIEFAEGMFEIYRQSYDRLNATYRKIYNRDLTRIEFYSHISREGKEGVDASTHNETMFIDMIVPEESDGTGIFPQKPDITKERVANASSEIRIGNVLSMYNKYVWDAEHFISHGEQLRLIDTLMRDEEFKATMEKNLSPGGFLNFQEHFKIAARSNESHTRTGKLWEVFETQRQRAFKANLLINEKIGLGQTATVMSWASRMPKEDFAFGTKFYALNPKEANAILNKHATFKDRELNFDSEIEQLSTTGKAFDLMSWTTRKGDGFGVRAGAIADVLSSVKRKGLSEKEALDSAARFAEGSQQSTLPSQRSLAQKSDDPLVRTMMMYRSSLVAMLNVSMQSITEYRQKDTSTPAKKAAARKKLAEVIVTQNVIIPGLYAAFTGRPITRTILVGSAAAIPFYSELLDVLVVVMKNLYDEEDDRVFFSGPLTVPAAEAFREVLVSLNSIDDIWESLKDGLDVADIGTFFESMSGVLDVMTDFPVKGAVNKWQAFKKFYETEDFLDAALQSLGFREEARELTIKRIDALTGIGEEESDTIVPVGAF